MREILFRGKNSKAGWVYGSYIRHETRQLCPIGVDKLAPDETVHYIARDGLADWNMPKKIELVPVDPGTVGQYTGMTDNAGQKAYEGDVLEDIRGNRYFLNYENGEFQLTSKSFQNYTVLLLWQLKIVGNIHDNPDLMGAHPQHDCTGVLADLAALKELGINVDLEGNHG